MNNTYNVGGYSLQEAIDAAHKNGGGVVSLESDKVYDLPVADGYALRLYENIIIEGNGATLKVSDNVGDYDAIMLGVPMAQDLSNLVIRNVIFDCNGRGNPITDVSSFASGARMAVRIYAGKHIRIECCVFKDAQNINTISINGVEVDDVHITNNKFYDTGGAGFDHDHSSIYVHGDNSVVTGNVFTATSLNANGARTAVETHGSGAVVSGNIIDGYNIGIIVSGVAHEDSCSLICSNNSIRNVVMGVVMYSNQYGTHTIGYGINGAHVSGNIINLISPEELPEGISPSGIVFNSPSDLPFCNVTISGNTIVGTLPNISRQPQVGSAGIGISGEQEILKNISITDNLITNMELAGIRMSCGTIENLTIKNNKIVNPGSTLYGNANQAYRTGVFMWSQSNTNTIIKNNEIIDDNAVSRLAHGLYLQSANTCKTVDVIDNSVRLTDIVHSSFVAQVSLASINIIPYLVGRYDNWIKPALWFRKGSRIMDTEVNCEYINIDGGSQWIVDMPG